MKHLANIYFLGVKELSSLWHDKVLLIVVIWAFSGGVYTVALSASTELHNAPIAIVDEDRSPLSARIINAFYGPYFKKPELIRLADANPGMDSGRYTFTLDIPPDFARDVLAGKQPELQINVDATRMTQAFIGTTYIQNIVNREINEFLSGYRTDVALPIELKIRVKYNQNLTTTWFGAVIEIINNITTFAIILAGAALIREREHGTIEHLLAMPLTPLEIMTAKVWSNGLVVLACASLSLIIVVKGALHVPITGSVPLFLLGVTLYLFSATSIGIFLGTFARSMPQFGLIMIMLILPLQMLSGGITPRESMPEIVQKIMLFAPTTHFVSFSQAILYRGAGFEVVWPSFLAIIGIGAAFFLTALAFFRKSIAIT